MGHLHRKPRHTLGQILCDHVAGWRDQRSVAPHLAKVLARLALCRTPALGGHVHDCAGCGYRHLTWNACRDRHCPACQTLAQAEWVAQRRQRLLGCPHFHLVFTLPGCLRRMARLHVKGVADALFLASNDALQALATERLGAQLGVTAVLHTWTRDLRWHPHVHALVTGGGLSRDGEAWVPSQSRYLFPQRQLAARFRLHLVRRLRAARKAGGLVLDPDDRQRDRRLWTEAIDGVHRHRCVVFVKATDQGIEPVLRYLGRYVARVALSNHRILAVTQDTVTIRGRRGPVTLPVHRFLDRFAQHVLPPGFRKVRHYGLYAPACVPGRLVTARVRHRAWCIADTGEPPPDPPAALSMDATMAERLEALLGIDVGRCPRCRGPLTRRPVEKVPAAMVWPGCWWDSS